MLSTKKGIVLVALGLALVQAGAAVAEPSYLVYPANAPTLFRYDVNRYDLIHSGQDKFDAQYAVGGAMLWDRVDGRVPTEIYGAMQLTGFEPTSGTSEYVIFNDNFDVVIDGFGPGPRTIGNPCLRFWPYSSTGNTQISIDGVPVNRLTVPLPSFEVDSPLMTGHYSGTALHRISWTGAQAMEIVAFSDKTGDGSYQGTPLYRIVSRLSPVAVESTSWGKVKALYR